jgi:hypothetical protein
MWMQNIFGKHRLADALACGLLLSQLLLLLLHCQ